MANKLVLDTDGGVDDAQALMMLVAGGRAPDAITTTFGNVGLEQATRNILDTLSVLGSDIPVHAGAARPLVQPIIDAKQIHGADGLGGAPRPESAAEISGGDAPEFLQQMLMDAGAKGEKIDILAIGPLTNIALLLRNAPQAAVSIGQLTIMGGTVHGRGNTTPAAEFNIYADPEAAEIVFSAGLDVLLVPWEVCVAHAITGAQVDEMLAAKPASGSTGFARALAEHARRVTMSFGNPDEFRFVDPLAAAVVVEPDCVKETLQAAVAVALAPGLTRGMTVVDPAGRLGPANVRIVIKADLARVSDLFDRSLG
jgi:purine nucleosidase